MATTTASRRGRGQSNVVPFDFRRPDRIAKSQLRAIHLLHDTFVRNLVSSLSAFLRSYLIVNLVSVEQLSYSEFLEGLPSYSTCQRAWMHTKTLPTPGSFLNSRIRFIMNQYLYLRDIADKG